MARRPWDTAYNWVIERARLAQEAGVVIDGIIFHQGESDSGQVEWIDKVKDMVEDLRTDLGIGEAAFVAGELLLVAAVRHPTTSSINCLTTSRIPNPAEPEPNRALGHQASGFSFQPDRSSFLLMPAA